jgi:ribosomal protein S18 acetylase RimI-like enzyme
LEKFELDKRIQLEQVEFLLESYKGSQLPLELRHFCFEIVEKHTRQELDCFNFLSTFRLTHCYSYESAGLWSASGKKAELRSDAARFLLVRLCFLYVRSVTFSIKVRSYPHMNLVGFVHYRFTIENQENVLYIYELHIVDGYQGLGIGKKLVQVLETIGVRTSKNVVFYSTRIRLYISVEMKKIMLTVFKRNVDAVRFYKEKLGLCGTILISSDTYAILGFLWMHRLQRFLETWNANMKFFLNTWFQYAKIVL